MLHHLQDLIITYIYVDISIYFDLYHNTTPDIYTTTQTQHTDHWLYRCKAVQGNR
jgi:hypothetical protein